MREKTRNKSYQPRRYKRILLQERDLRILEYGLEQKFLTIEQITERFFNPGNGTKHRSQAAYRRALILQKFGLVRLMPLQTGGKVVQITAAGAHELTIRRREHLPPAPSVDYRTYEHDRRITDVRILFENLGLISGWLSDRYLKATLHGTTRVPDAIFTLNNGQRVALELELARKGRTRHRRIFSEYLEKRFGDIQLLFFICNTFPQLKSLAQHTSDFKWVYFAQYDQLVRDRDQAVFANQLEQFQLKELI